MRVATFNILHGRSPEDDRVDLDRFSEAVKSLDADVLALQEVDRNQPRSSGADLTALAAEATGSPYHRFVAALSGNPGAMWMAADGDEQPDAAAYGVALLSRHPVHAWEVVRLPPAPVPAPMRFRGSLLPDLVRDEPRVALAAIVESPIGPLTVATTHLTFVPWWNRPQLRRLRRSLADLLRPMLLTGDFNMSRGPAERHTGLRSLVTADTFPAHEPREQLDHVLASEDLPHHVTAATAHRLPLSDHLALSVDLA